MPEGLPVSRHWNFADLPSTPKAVVEGPLSFKLKVGKAKDFHIHIQEVWLASLDYREPTADTPRLCRLLIGARLLTSPYRVPAKAGGVGERYAGGLTFTAAPVFVDADGKIWPAVPHKGQRR